MRPAFWRGRASLVQGQKMDFQLTGQQRRMVETVRELAQGEFKANAQKYMDGTFPWENMRKLAEIGVLGMSVPEEYGGLGLPVFDTALDRKSTRLNSSH